MCVALQIYDRLEAHRCEPTSEYHNGFYWDHGAFRGRMPLETIEAVLKTHFRSLYPDSASAVNRHGPGVIINK